MTTCKCRSKWQAITGVDDVAIHYRCTRCRGESIQIRPRTPGPQVGQGVKTKLPFTATVVANGKSSELEVTEDWLASKREEWRPQHWFEINAKFGAKCAECGAPIAKGDRIRWAKDAGPHCLGECEYDVQTTRR